MTSEKNCLKITHNGHELVEGSLSIGGMIHNTTTTTNKAVQTTGQHYPPQAISTGRCQPIWPEYAMIG